ncbi:ankyrin [Choiromyces venosus 120613-1]|uniref:Ankyrin n=1 Tax=Choiromyces venosus 120613-1 TaxID=1336337 RepID=A0A3N4IU90_9PEZI|nr:ankyrin [Choiromyces venosus 120613-1]
MERWDLNGSDSNGATPLVWAAKHGNYRLAKLLLEQQDVNPNISDSDGLLHHLHMLLWAYILKWCSCSWTGRVPIPNCCITLAARHYHMLPIQGMGVAVKLLLEPESVNPDSLDRNGRTPLPYTSTAEGGHEGVVKLFLDRESVNPDSSDMCGGTPLSYAARHGHEGVPIYNRISDELTGTLASQPEKHNPDPIGEQSQLTPGLPATTPAEKAVPGPESAEQDVSPNAADKTPEEQAVSSSRSDQSPTNICPASLPASTIWIFSSETFVLSFIIILFA